jgi:hypothetical protein
MRAAAFFWRRSTKLRRIRRHRINFIAIGIQVMRTFRVGRLSTSPLQAHYFDQTADARPSFERLRTLQVVA